MNAVLMARFVVSMLCVTILLEAIAAHVLMAMMVMDSNVQVHCGFKETLFIELRTQIQILCVNYIIITRSDCTESQPIVIVKCYKPIGAVFLRPWP